MDEQALLGLNPNADSDFRQRVSYSAESFFKPCHHRLALGDLNKNAPGKGLLWVEMNRNKKIWDIWIYFEYRNSEYCDLFSVYLAKQKY